MWVFLSGSFLSIIADPDNPVSETLIVRARAKGDIERIFPAARVTRTPDRDYLYRAMIPRGRVAAALAGISSTITYTNFKDSVKNDRRHDAYLRVWGAMAAYQNQLEPRSKTPALDFLDDIRQPRKGRGRA